MLSITLPVKAPVLSWALSYDCETKHTVAMGTDRLWAGMPKGNREVESGNGNEIMWLDMGTHHQMGCRLTVVAFSRGSLLRHLGHEEDRMSERVRFPSDTTH